MGSKRRPDMELEAHYLREYRKLFDMSLEAVAARLGITKSALSRIETRKSLWDQFILQQLSRIYGVSIPALLYQHPVVVGRLTFRKKSAGDRVGDGREVTPQGGVLWQ